MRLLSILAVVIALASALRAHDFWIEPTTFRPAVGTRIDVDLRVGERHVGDSVARNDARIARFVAASSAGTSAITGVDGRAPAGLLRCAHAGSLALAYESKPAELELEAKKFEAYLVEEGLEHAIEERVRRGESSKPGRERYRRSAKALLAVGGEESAGFDRKVGLPLEIVPRTNPLTARVGDVLEFEVLYEGRPLEGVLVGSLPKSAPERETRLRTDEHGRVRFELRVAGVHLVRVVHIVREPEGSPFDWLSTWGALGFDVLPARVPAETPLPRTPERQPSSGSSKVAACFVNSRSTTVA